MVFTFPENALNLCIFTHAPVPDLKLQLDFLKICFPKDERGSGNSDLLYQNSIKKYEDDFKH